MIINWTCQRSKMNRIIDTLNKLKFRKSLFTKPSILAKSFNDGQRSMPTLGS